MIRDGVPLGWTGPVHVTYRTVGGQRRTRGCQNHTDARLFCDGVDHIDRLLNTSVNRDWTVTMCRCPAAPADDPTHDNAGQT